MNLAEQIVSKTQHLVSSLYGVDVEKKLLQVQKTRIEFDGDYTLVVFPILKLSRKSPEQTAEAIGAELIKDNLIADYNVIKGFLNLSISNYFWVDHVFKTLQTQDYGIVPQSENARQVMIEYSSPNTNKPLHLGHIRNNLLGASIANILKANGHEVKKVNLVNDRGIHICKSMLAWKKWGNGATPQSTGIKGDKLVGDYYVLFDQHHKKQIEEHKEQGLAKEEARQQSPVLLEAQQLLRKWEEGDEEVIQLWKMMNNWVYEGFDETYQRLGIDFDKIYYESDTYKLGKKIVLQALKDKKLIKKEDNSVWADLRQHGLDEKILLRADGTSVYMTQDIGTAIQRYEDQQFDKHLYVVGNEQNYHFQVLKLILKELGYEWSDRLEHISYGMVELPGGKMKSREGKVVDADDLMDHMIETAKTTSEELGKLEGLSPEDHDEIINKVALGALKYFILKVDPKKNMLFNPEESIDFNGHTGPFVQYTYARIQSLIRKSSLNKDQIVLAKKDFPVLDKKEKDLVRLIYDFPAIISEAGDAYSPSVIANYVYEIAKLYNQFYHDFPVLKETDEHKKMVRLGISLSTAEIIKTSLKLLGIGAPERM